eukprot:scaffold5688_cov104-Cylindrotheca_fusiformis.AAC.10
MQGEWENLCTEHSVHDAVGFLANELVHLLLDNHVASTDSDDDFDPAGLVGISKNLKLWLIASSFKL